MKMNLSIEVKGLEDVSNRIAEISEQVNRVNAEIKKPRDLVGDTSPISLQINADEKDAH